MWDEQVFFSCVQHLSSRFSGGKGLDHEEGSGGAVSFGVDSRGSSTMWLGITDFQTPTQNHLSLDWFKGKS